MEERKKVLELTKIMNIHFIKKKLPIKMERKIKIFVIIINLIIMFIFFLINKYRNNNVIDNNKIKIQEQDKAKKEIFFYKSILKEIEPGNKNFFY